MKKISTLFFILLSIGVYSQSGNLPRVPRHGMPAIPTRTNFEVSKKFPIGLPSKARANNHSSSRSQYNTWFYLDYGSMDSLAIVYGPDAGNTWYRDDQYSFGVINTSLPIDSFNYYQYAFTWYPQLVDFINNPNWPYNNYNPNDIQMTIDTVYVTCGHLHNSNAYDTITISIWDYDTFNYSDSFAFYPTEGVNGILYGQKQIIVNNSIFGGNGAGTSPGTVSVGTYPFSFADNPVAVPTGSRFIIQITFNAPANDEFFLGSARRNSCASQCGASVPYIFDSYIYLEDPGTVGLDSFNSQYGIRYEDDLGDTGAFPSTYFYTNCNGLGVESDCELIDAQDFDIYPNIEAVLSQIYVVASASPAAACLNSSVTLTANAAGSTATPYSYFWTATSGNLSGNTGKQVKLTTTSTNNDTVIVVVTDQNNNSASDTFIVKSNAIDLSVTSQNPITINCNSSAFVSTSVSGDVTGAYYAWSNGATGPDVTTQTLSTAGIVTITVTNSAQCADSATVTINYNGVSNAASFELPDSIGIEQWAGCTLVFTNTSASYTAPWTGTFYGGDGDSVNGAIKQIYYTYQQAGTYPATLILDSAGCTFTATKTVRITTKPNGEDCTVVATGTRDLAFGNGISLTPNPTSGYLHLTVNGVQNNISIKVYDVLGNEVMSYQANELPTGVYNKDLDLNALPGGTYLVRIDSGDQSAVKKVVISR